VRSLGWFVARILPWGERSGVCRIEGHVLEICLGGYNFNDLLLIGKREDAAKVESKRSWVRYPSLRTSVKRSLISS